MLWKASAPGSLMLIGEYAVLKGASALCAAINKRIEVRLTPRNDNKIIIHSALGEFSCDLADLIIEKPFQFVLATLLFCKLDRGCELAITSEFSHQMGLGSSAATTVATLAAIYQSQNKTINNEILLRDGIQIVRNVQGKGSGADIAASIYGGIVHYQNDTVLEKITELPQISVIFSGEKTLTAKAIDIINERFANNLEELSFLYTQMAQLTEESVAALKNFDWISLGKYFNHAQTILEDLGVSTEKINAAIQILHHDPAILGAKISGAGLGDCVIGIGKAAHENMLDIKLGTEGLHTQDCHPCESGDPSSHEQDGFPLSRE